MSFSFTQWKTGTSANAYEFFGCHPDGQETVFRVWAPGAENLYVTGSFCGWDPCRYPMQETEPGLFCLTLPGISQYDVYKYVRMTADGQPVFKSDPFAFHAETAPANASKVYAMGNHAWGDGKWMSRRSPDGPLNLYQLHAGAFRTYAGGEPLNYCKLGEELASYLKKLGCTHADFLPLLEYMDPESWGRKTTGFFAITSRYGVPDDFRQMVDVLHQAEIGAVMDWCPAGFPADDFGLADFAGGPYWEAGGQEGDFRFFDFRRPEVQSFLLSSACRLFEVFHLDGLRVAGTAQIAQRPGGREFLETLAAAVRRDFPSAFLIGGPECGAFSFREDPESAWRIMDMAAGKPGELPRAEPGRILELEAEEMRRESLIGRMPGSYDEKFARLRAGTACFRLFPGSKLSMMGNELAQFSAWQPYHELDWLLLDYELHRKFLYLLRSLNDFAQKSAAVRAEHPGSHRPLSLNAGAGIVGYIRQDEAGSQIFVLANFTENPAERLTIGVDRRGKYAELFNTDEAQYGGEGRSSGVNFAKLRPADGKPYCIEANLPPFTTVYLYKSAGAKRPAKPV